ncbi:MAG: hypothetical protein JKY34_16550 [Kordiimonadaceae bacterium]|nr:hypothetical protein [Kordiimonadaceae bacterium]
MLNNERHPSIAADYAATFSFLKSIEPDVFIAQHPSLYGAASKREAMMKGAEKIRLSTLKNIKPLFWGKRKSIWIKWRRNVPNSPVYKTTLEGAG